MSTENKTSAKIKLHINGKVPFVAYYVLKGKLELVNKKGQHKELQQGEAIGIKELWNHTPLEYDILITPETKVLNLDKSLLSRLKETLSKDMA